MSFMSGFLNMDGVAAFSQGPASLPFLTRAYLCVSAALWRKDQKIGPRDADSSSRITVDTASHLGPSFRHFCRIRKVLDRARFPHGFGKYHSDTDLAVVCVVILMASAHKGLMASGLISCASNDLMVKLASTVYH